MDVNRVSEKINKAALDIALLDLSSVELRKEAFRYFEQLKELDLGRNFIIFNRIIDVADKYIFSSDLDAKQCESMFACLVAALHNYLLDLSNNADLKNHARIFEERIEKIAPLSIQKSSSPAPENRSENIFDALEYILIPEFLSGASDVLDEIKTRLSAVEQCGLTEQSVNKIFKSFHNLKGESNLLSLLNFAGVARKCEDIFEQIKSNKISFDTRLLNALFSIIDTLKNYIAIASTDINEALSISFDDDLNSLSNIGSDRASRQNPSPNTSNTTLSDPKVIVRQQTSRKTDYQAKVPEIDFSLGADLFIEFIAESNEHLTTVEDSVIELEKDTKNADIINKVFRAFHTIKGVSSFLNLADISKLAHTSETMLDLVRSGDMEFGNDVADITLESVDFLRNLLSLLEEQIANEGKLLSEYINISPLLSNIEALTAGNHKNSPKDKLNVELEEGIPAALYQTLQIDKDTVNRDNLEGLPLQDEPLIIQLQSENENAGCDEPAPMEEAKDEKNAGCEDAMDNPPKKIKESETIDNNVQPSSQGSIKINVEKLDVLIDLVGELVISETQVLQHNLITQIDDSSLTKEISELDRITRLLQNVSMGMRLVPVRATFQKMVRIIRDLSRKTNKKINVVLSGEDTEIDKNMIALINDPLVHMVRNAVDHGLEPEDVRIKNNKSVVGTIELAAYHKAGNVVIQIKDDGAGLNKEKIIAKALEKGLINEKENFSENRIFNLVFEPGFSTAQEITDVSGRGVGMDVVKRNIEKLRGKIEIESKEGAGTVFSFYLPLTLAIIEGIILRVVKERYILPITNIIEFIPASIKSLIQLSNGSEVYRFNDEIYPVIRLDECFGINTVVADFDQKILCIVESDYGRVAILVDELLGEQQVVIKSLGENLRNIKGVSGGAILGDGAVGLILDVNGIVEANTTRKKIECVNEL
ncbi:chemotaxis protein CheW [bacterium]|nr:chemotaxis protein CheW [bacterium]